MTHNDIEQGGFQVGIESHRRSVPLRLLAGIAALALAGTGCAVSGAGDTPDRPITTPAPIHQIHKRVTSHAAAPPSPSLPRTVTVKNPPVTAPTETEPSAATEDFKVAQTFIVGFDASTPKSIIEQVVAETHIGGLYLTGTTDAIADGFTPAFFNHLSELAGSPMIVAMDDEGGEINRNAATGLPSAWQMGQMQAAEVTQLAERAGKVMRADGVTVDLAPVDDLDNGRQDGAISRYERSFGGSPSNIAAKAGAFLTGLQAEGATAVLKHFPGIGYASPDSDTDSHKAVSPPLAALEQNDLVPYKKEFKGDQVNVVMLSNEYVTGLDSSEPASISPTVVRYLRSMGFHGIITTDALTSITGYDGESLAQNVVDAVKAGVNMPLFGFTSEADIDQAIEDTVSSIPSAQITNSYVAVKALKAK